MLGSIGTYIDVSIVLRSISKRPIDFPLVRGGVGPECLSRRVSSNKLSSITIEYDTRGYSSSRSIYNFLRLGPTIVIEMLEVAAVVVTSRYSRKYRRGHYNIITLSELTIPSKQVPLIRLIRSYDGRDRSGL